MAIREVITQGDILLYEILRNPCLFGEFVENIDKLPYEEEFRFHDYQNEMIMDFSTYVSFCTGRSVGKTVSISHLMSWALTFNIFPSEYLVYTVPGRAHLEPVFNALVRLFRTNSFLKHFIASNSGVNNSDFTIHLLNQSDLFCRIAGQSGSGLPVVGLHSPYEFVDECVVGSQLVRCKNGKNPISHIKSGDIVISWDGENTVEDRVISTQKVKKNQNVLEIGFDGGYIRIGEHHRIYTDAGYIEAHLLNIKDNIYHSTNSIRQRWTKNEIDIVKKRIKNSVPVYEIAKELNRTELGVFRKISHLGLSVREIFDSIPLTEEEFQVIAGSFLGDGSAQIEPYRARYTTNHSLKQKEYVDWLRIKLNRLIRVEPRISKNGGWGTYNYSLSTIGHPTILTLANELYINGKKTITRYYLDRLTPLGFAIWFMDDGSESGMLSTHSFSESENEIIKQYLWEKWGIESKIYKDKRKSLYFIVIRIKSLSILRKIIEPYIPECMGYKIGKGKYNNTLPEISIIKNGENKQSLEKKEITYIKKIKSTARYLYNIEVENNHNYFINGILTKNSGYYPYPTFIEFRPTFNKWMPGCKLIVSGVPTGLRENNVLYHCDQEDSSFSKHRISADDNPRLTKEDREQAIVDYGGEDSEDFEHLWRGRHGRPVFALFDRSLMEISNYPVSKLEIDGIKLADNIALYVERLSLLPGLPHKDYSCFFGIDLGYTQPSAIYVLYIDNYGRIKFHAKIKLSKVSYPIQERLIDYLDSKYNPLFLGMDEGSSGKSVKQHLMEDKEYWHKDYEKRLIPIDFSSWVILGYDSEKKEIKSKTKPYATTILQEWANSHKIIFTSTDLETVTELERMTFTKNPSGEIVYRTLTERGGKRGEDHFTAALLCATMAHYITYDSLTSVKHVQLFKGGWIGNIGRQL